MPNWWQLRHICLWSSDMSVWVTRHPWRRRIWGGLPALSTRVAVQIIPHSGKMHAWEWQSSCPLVWPNTCSLMISITWWHRADHIHLDAGWTELRTWLAFPKHKRSSEALARILDRVRAGDGYFDIQPIQIILVHSVNEKAGTNQIIGLFILEAVCSVEYAHAMNISHDELTWPLGLQQEVQEDHQAKLRAAQRGDGGPPRPQQIRATILMGLDKMNDMKHMTPTGTHRDGGPFGISLESLSILPCVTRTHSILPCVTSSWYFGA